MSTQQKPHKKKEGEEDKLIISESPSGSLLTGTMTTEERLAEEKKYKDGKLLEKKNS